MGVHATFFVFTSYFRLYSSWSVCQRKLFIATTNQTNYTAAIQWKSLLEKCILPVSDEMRIVLFYIRMHVSLEKLWQKLSSLRTISLAVFSIVAVPIRNIVRSVSHRPKPISIVSQSTRYLIANKVSDCQ